jgi:microtubule-associated protein-like 6
MSRGDELHSIKPWLGAIKEPTTYYKDPLSQSLAPPATLALDFIFGYNARTSRNNIKYL